MHWLFLGWCTSANIFNVLRIALSTSIRLGHTSTSVLATCLSARWAVDVEASWACAGWKSLVTEIKRYDQRCVSIITVPHRNAQLISSQHCSDGGMCGFSFHIQRAWNFYQAVPNIFTIETEILPIFSQQFTEPIPKNQNIVLSDQTGFQSVCPLHLTIETCNVLINAFFFWSMPNSWIEACNVFFISIYSQHFAMEAGNVIFC